MKYLVDQKYYDDGTIIVSKSQVSDEYVSYEYTETKYDCYGNIFETKQQADDFIRQCKTA